MPQVGFKPTFSAGQRPQTYALERAATGTGLLYTNEAKYTQHRCKVLKFVLFIKQGVTFASP